MDEAFLHWGISGTYINNQSEITFFIVFLCILCIYAETAFKAGYGGAAVSHEAILARGVGGAT
jgi:hypothetical protein